MRPIIHKFLLCLHLVLLCCNLSGQTEAKVVLDRLQLNQALYPPEGILSSKSIVLLSVPEVSERNEWMILVDELQQFLAEEGIDAVAYIEDESLFSRPNEVLQIPDFLKKREVKNLILFSASDKDAPVFLAMGPYNGKDTFFDQSATFWARSGAELSLITDELRAYFQTGSLSKTNLLVNEKAEFFYPEVSLGIVAKSIPPRLAEFKVAVERVDQSVYGQSGPAAFRFDRLYKEDSFNLAMTDRDYVIQSLVVDSTNNIFSREFGKTNQQLRQQGFQYQLMYVTATEDRLYEMLPFPDRPKPGNKVTHKFYLSDLRNNNIYVGKTWDASTDWNTALQQFLSQMDAVIHKD